MKHDSRKAEVIDLVARSAAGCAGVACIGLFIPDLRPLALKLGTGICFGVTAAFVGVLVYIGWWLVCHSGRKRKLPSSSRVC
jgi:phage shock protein PspC (stress-responsive transcriptional regulator)